MNVITFFEDLASNYNDKQQCGECWTFGAPLSNSGMNASKSDAPCCVHLFLTFYRTSSNYQRNSITGLANRHYTDHSFILYVVKQSRVDLNTYNEQTGHPIDASLWMSILEPLQNCLGSGNELDLCELGYEFDITRLS